jgi:hypothetical protein
MGLQEGPYELLSVRIGYPYPIKGHRNIAHATTATDKYVAPRALKVKCISVCDITWEFHKTMEEGKR